MSNIFNFANRNLCEYQSIFPTVERLLDHLLFTIGNGYDFDSKSGMIYYKGKGRQYIDKYPAMNKRSWEKLITECHAKELKFAQMYSNGQDIDQAELAEDCAKYKPVSVDASMFSERGLYQQLQDRVQEKKNEAGSFRDPSFVRPYPLSEGYSSIFDLNENTPTWFLQIALNYCNAWTRFLTDELNAGNVWIKPSLRPKVELTEEQQRVRDGMKELFAMLKEDKDYDGWLDKPKKEPESDYADATWTTTHRDMIAGQANRISEILAQRVTAV